MVHAHRQAPFDYAHGKHGGLCSLERQKVVWSLTIEAVGFIIDCFGTLNNRGIFVKAGTRGIRRYPCGVVLEFAEL